MEGGRKPRKINPNTINRFSDNEMARYLNPIYGVILANNGTLKNNFFLALSGFVDKNDPKIKMILNVCKRDPSSLNVMPTNAMLYGGAYGSKQIAPITPIDIGRHIAIKYINSKLETKLFIPSALEKNVFVINPAIINKTNKGTLDALKKEINTLNRFIPFDNYNIFSFNLLLYCLWWVANDADGIDAYYQSVQQIFNIVNGLGLAGINFQIGTGLSNHDFENDIFKMIPPESREFITYNEEYSRDFCTNREAKFPDCGETVARNLINLLCFDTSNKQFNVSLLEEKGAIPALIEYYRVFNNFELQNTGKQNIYGINLNSRDAWSKLIIDNAQENINFREQCSNETQNYRFNMKSGKTLDGNKSNLLQLIHNLLPGINDWEDLVNRTNITNVDVDLDEYTHFGTIVIYVKPHTITGEKAYEDEDEDIEFIVNLDDSHYSIERLKAREEEYMFQQQLLIFLSSPYYFSTVDDELAYKSKYVITLLGKVIEKRIELVTINNYLEINIDILLLVELLKAKQSFYLDLFRLSLTDIYTIDYRWLIEIDTYKNPDLFNLICDNFGANIKMNEYTYDYYNNFDFVNQIPSLIHLNSVAIGDIPLSNVKDFLNINLNPLRKLETIGHEFLQIVCREIKYDRMLPEIDLTPLANIKSIGNSFMNGCNLFKKIRTPRFENLETIGFGFLNDIYLPNPNINVFDNKGKVIEKIQNTNNELTLDMPVLKKIDSGFIALSNINKITLNMPMLIVVGNEFLYNISDLTNPILNMPSLETVGDNFLSKNNFDVINLNFPALETIGYNFLHINYLHVINFNFPKLKVLTNGFMSNSSQIMKINLSKLISLTRIEDNIMDNCNKLHTIIVPNESIREQFIDKKAKGLILKKSDKRLIILIPEPMDGGKRKTIRRNKNRNIRRSFKKLGTPRKLKGLNRKQTRRIKK